VSWEYAPNFDAACRAALSSKNNLVYVCPPAWWTTLPLFKELPAEEPTENRIVVLIPDSLGLQECAVLLDTVEQCAPAFAVSGLTRTERVLRSGSTRTIVATPGDVLKLLSRSAIDSSSVATVVIGWPKLILDENTDDVIDTILAECRDAQRIVLTSNHEDVADFVERHARRAPVARSSASESERAGSARYAVTDFRSIPEHLRSALDVLDPKTALVWDPLNGECRAPLHAVRQPGVFLNSVTEEQQVDLAIALELPTNEVLEGLFASAKEVLLLLRPHQIGLAKAMLERARPLRLPSEADKAQDKAFALRKMVRDDIENHSQYDGYLALSSLFDEYDPATVAAALAARLSVPEPLGTPDGDVPTWVRIRIESGKRHRIRTGDLVGALLNAVEVPKNRVGKVDVREGYSLVEVRADEAEKALKGLNGLSLRGNKLAARLDRR